MLKAVYLRVDNPSSDYTENWYQLILRTAQICISCGNIDTIKKSYKKLYSEYGDDNSLFEREYSGFAHKKQKLYPKEADRNAQYMNKFGNDYDFLLEKWAKECREERKAVMNNAFNKRRKKFRPLFKI